MGKGRTVVDFLRAGALAAGTAILLGLWCQGMHRLGFRGVYPDGLPDFLIPFAIGVALATWLGFPGPTTRPLNVLGRLAGTIIVAIAIGAAVGGISALLAKVLDVGESNFPYFFLPVGLVLVAVGLRRLPESRAARLALGIPVALLALMRLSVFWPGGAHAISRRIYPLQPAMVRAAVESEGWGPLARGQRTRITAFESTPTYYTRQTALYADAAVKMTVEVAKTFFVDGCGDLHDSQPKAPDWANAYPDLAACLKEHPNEREERFEMVHFRHSPCCLSQSRERHPGETINLQRTWRFVFTRLAWRAL